MDSTRLVSKKTLSRYRIDSVLGSGAMGMVYLAFDQQIQREVALKVLHPHLRVGAAGEELEQRFLQEARAAARCTHPNIVTIFDFGIHDGESFIVMEYVRGTELKAYLNQGTTIPLLSACDICVQVLEALAHAHDNGVVHRDIKPANIIMLDNSVVKVSDFGVARLDSSDLTGTGMMIGTPNYMSPEAKMGGAVDHRADLYSVGVLLHELICSQKPDLSLALEEILNHFDTMGVLGGEKLTKVKRILSLALQPKAAERYQHAREFINDLKAVTSGEGVPVEPTRLLMPKPRPKAPPTGPSTSITGGSQSQWQPEVVHSLEQSLAEFVGPLAKRLVRKQCQSNQHFETLIARLAQHIPNEAERTQFMKNVARFSSGLLNNGRAVLDDTAPTNLQVGGSYGGVNSELGQIALSQATFKQLTKFLAYYVGPLASRMVKSSMRSTSEPNALLGELASRIPHEEERQKFINEAKTLF